MNANVSIQTYRIILCCCIFAVIVILSALGYEFYRTKDFICVDANISEIRRKVETNSKNDAHSSVVWYIKCEYEFEGVTYQTQYRTLFVVGKHSGNSLKLYCSPSSPNIVRNHFLIEVCICGLILLILFTIATAKFFVMASNKNT